MSGYSSSGEDGTVTIFPDEIAEALASLQLPHMPTHNLQRRPTVARDGRTSASAHEDDDNDDDSKNTSRSKHQNHQLPTIRILVVADIDLSSASALAEYALLQERNHRDSNNNDNDGNSEAIFNAERIDLCIAAGSFVRDEDLLPYLRGKQRRRETHRLATTTTSVDSTNLEQQANNNNSAITSTPFFRSRDQTAALEGLMTAALSQLESIVCRVVYCPGSADPITTLLPHISRGHPRRLTPNSRNLHHHWLPLAPGIGCAALLYMDASEQVLNEKDNMMDHHEYYHSSSHHHHYRGRNRTLATGGNTNTGYGDGDEGGDEQDYNQDHDPDDASDRGTEEGAEDEEEEEEDVMALWCEQLRELQESSKGYCATLERLLTLSPTPQHPVPLRYATAQSILVTHYMDCQPIVDNMMKQQQQQSNYNSNVNSNNNAKTADYLPANGMPLWTLEKEDRPWPVDHASFLNSKTAQDLLCLEIASGSAAKHKPELLRVGSGNKYVLLPGSLRERGEFCIVELSLQEQHEEDDPKIIASASTSASASKNQMNKEGMGSSIKSRRTFAWNVSKVDFHKVGHFRQH